MAFLLNSSIIHLWTPGLFEFKGGIQTFSRYLCDSLAEVAPTLPQSVFSMHDQRFPKERKMQKNQSFHFMGQCPAKLRIAAYAAQVFLMGLWQRPELILSTHLNLAVVAYHLKRLYGQRYWVVAHGFEAWNATKPSVIKALKNADRILAVSHFTRDQLIQNYQIDPDKIHFFPNTFESDRFSIQPKSERLLKKLNLDADQPVLMTVNRLESGEDFKPYDQVLKALPQIKETVPNVHYVIVGKGDDRQRLEEDIKARHLEDVVTLAGFVPDEELDEYYSLCDLYIMPSKLEGFGIVYLEALAAGKPVIASLLDGGRSALKEGELGALVNPESVTEIAERAIEILQKQFDHPLIYDAQKLRAAVIDAYGKEQFNHMVASELDSLSLTQSDSFEDSLARC